VTTLIEQIEQMRLRMNQLATEEHELIRSLGDALASADQRLLDEVRSVAAAHESRRGAILRELQVLAGRMCALHNPSDEPFAAVPPFETEGIVQSGDRGRTAASIQEEIASHLRIGATRLDADLDDLLTAKSPGAVGNGATSRAARGRRPTQQGMSPLLKPHFLNQSCQRTRLLNRRRALEQIPPDVDHAL
jgi:hypothetical protein